MTTKAPSRSKLRTARRSKTVWFSAAVPVLLAAAESLKEQLPAMAGLLTGWRLVAASVLVSAVVTALLGIPVDRDRSFRRIVTGDSGLS
jgi:hypothetical protein